MSLRIQPIDGPARGVLVTTASAPKYLRLAHSRQDGWRSVERATDAPHGDESVAVYVRQGDVDRTPRDRTQLYAVRPSARYVTAKPQPTESTMRDNARWRAWVDAQVGETLTMFGTPPSAPSPLGGPDGLVPEDSTVRPRAIDVRGSGLEDPNAPADGEPDVAEASAGEPEAEAAPPRRPANGPLTLIIDGDAIAWRAAHYAKSAEDAARGARQTVDKLVRTLGATRAIVCLSDPSRRYFRHDLFAGYKPRQSERPFAVEFALRELEERTGTSAGRILLGLEADDVCGILMTCPSIVGERILVADDKDLLTVPGQHFRLGRRFDVSPAEAGARHLIQTLVGDSGDGYPGCPGVGPKRAEQVVTIASYADSPAGAWRAVVAAFEQRGLGAADALLQARLARILQHDDYDLERRAVRPWLPPELAAMRLAVPA